MAFYDDEKAREPDDSDVDHHQPPVRRLPDKGFEKMDDLLNDPKAFN